MSIITIIGAGMMGTAIGYPAAGNGHEIRLVGTPLDDQIIDHAISTHTHLTMKRPIPEGFKFYHFTELDEAMQGAELVVSGVSSFGVDWFSDNILPILPEDMPILGVTKGMVDLPDGSLISYPEYYKSKHPGRKMRLCAVGGPCTSYELADHDPTEVCFCGDEPALLRWIRGLFECDYYHISLSTDVRGVECAVAMKNAYALAVTLAVGLSEACVLSFLSKAFSPFGPFGIFEARTSPGTDPLIPSGTETFALSGMETSVLSGIGLLHTLEKIPSVKLQSEVNPSGAFRRKFHDHAVSRF